MPIKNEGVFQVGIDDHSIEGYKKNCFSNNQVEIIMNKMRPEVSLKSHNHLFSQFGYCFKGKFNFSVEDQTYVIEEGESYNLASNLVHGASIIEEIVALDFKYLNINEAVEHIKIDVLEKQNDFVSIFSFRTISVTLLEEGYFKEKGEFKFSISKENYLISYNDTKVKIRDKIYKINGQKIYQITGYDLKSELEIRMENSGKVILIQLNEWR